MLATDLPVLVDADALTMLSRDPGLVRGRRAPTLLTPHAGEYGRLTGVDAQERLPTGDAVRATAAELGVTVLLKGSRTLVVAPDGAARVNSRPAKLATAGSGDVLSGAAGRFSPPGWSRRGPPRLAAYLHGLAGSIAAGGATTSATGVLDALPDALRTVLAAGGPPVR